MSANTETTGADRTKCKAFCGKTIEDIKSDKSADCEWRDAPMEPHLWHNYRRYCTPACRDARLPPIAAPAAHVERRKGQRWRCDIVGTGTVVGTLIDLRDHHWSVRRDDGSSDVWIETRWKISGFTMTLLADATPEAANRSRCLDTPGAHHPDGHCCAEPRPKSPSAPEAPKAAPVQFWFTDDEGEKIGPFATGLEADDASVAYGAWMRTQTGKPYAGPERLPLSPARRRLGRGLPARGGAVMGALSCSCTFPRINCPLECVQACDACRVARDAEIRATMTEANGDVEIQRVDKERIRKERDAARVEIQRLKGELAEARGLLSKVADPQGDDVPIDGAFGKVLLERGRPLHDEILAFLAAPSPAESTPIPRPRCAGWRQMEPDEREDLDERTFCDIEESSAGPGCKGTCPMWDDVAEQPAPPDDIRARLDAFDTWRADAVGWGRDIERRIAALEANGEPPTHLCPNDYGGPCFSPSRHKGAKP